jgi:hypothetical protein
MTHVLILFLIRLVIEIQFCQANQNFLLLTLIILVATRNSTVQHNRNRIKN